MTLSSYFLGLSILFGCLVLVFAVSYAVLHLRRRQQTRDLRAGIRQGSVHQQPAPLPARLAR